jgi:hypothetical protein
VKVGPATRGWSGAYALSMDAAVAPGMVDLRPIGIAFRRRGWLVALAVVIGAACGYAAGVSGMRVFEAKRVLFIGRAIAPSGEPIQTLANNPAALAAIAHSAAVLQRVSRSAKLPYAELAQGVGAAPLGGTNTSTGPPSPFFVITVEGPRRVPVSAAASLLARVVLDDISGYERSQIAELTGQLERFGRELRSLRRQLALLRQIAGQGPAVTLSEQGVLTAEGQLRAQSARVGDLRAASRASSLPRLASAGLAADASARTGRSSALVGGAIALILGGVGVLSEAGLRRGAAVEHAPAPSRSREPAPRPAALPTGVSETEPESAREVTTARVLTVVGFVAMLVGSLLAASSVFGPVGLLASLAGGAVLLGAAFVLGGHSS